MLIILGLVVADIFSTSVNIPVWLYILLAVLYLFDWTVE